jgi:3-methyladenine DNA glycosylase AlkD
MNLKETVAVLADAGTAQTRKTLARHGVGPDMFGVSYAVFGKLVKKIKQDHALAVELWATGNHDCRVLATMIADPAALTVSEVDSWAKDLDNYAITDAFARLVARSKLARSRAEKWIAADGERIECAGWTILACLAGTDTELSDADCEKLLAKIEKGIHAAKNRVRYTMNSTLISIGGYRANLTAKALAASGRIGKVEVDHGDTDCKTPVAADYIRKMVARRKK